MESYPEKPQNLIPVEKSACLLANCRQSGFAQSKLVNGELTTAKKTRLTVRSSEELASLAAGTPSNVYINEHELALFTNTSVHTWRADRSKRITPKIKFRRLGSRVVYCLADVMAYMESRRC